jgi:hypothetical protein
MANDLIVRKDFDDDVAEIKKELLPLLRDDELWHRLVCIVLKQPQRLSDYFSKDEFASFIALIVVVGMLRPELIEWSKQQ